MERGNENGQSSESRKSELGRLLARSMVLELLTFAQLLVWIVLAASCVYACVWKIRCIRRESVLFIVLTLASVVKEESECWGCSSLSYVWFWPVHPMFCLSWSTRNSLDDIIACPLWLTDVPCAQFTNLNWVMKQVSICHCCLLDWFIIYVNRSLHLWEAVLEDASCQHREEVETRVSNSLS